MLLPSERVFLWHWLWHTHQLHGQWVVLHKITPSYHVLLWPLKRFLVECQFSLKHESEMSGFGFIISVYLWFHSYHYDMSGCVWHCCDQKCTSSCECPEVRRFLLLLLKEQRWVCPHRRFTLPLLLHLTTTLNLTSVCSALPLISSTLHPTTSHHHDRFIVTASRAWAAAPDRSLYLSWSWKWSFFRPRCLWMGARDWHVTAVNLNTFNEA